VHRRDFLARLLAAGAAGRAHPLAQAPAIITPDHPAMPYGVASGDVTLGRATVCSRADRPARLVVDWDTTEAFANPRRADTAAALPESGLTARVSLEDLPPGQRIHYRVRVQDLADPRRWSEPVVGSFVSPPVDRRAVTLAWSACCVGQGWGINEAWGGIRIYETMRRARPDAFLHLGDTVYPDQPLLPEVKLDDGSLWHNVVTPAKAKVAETLDEFRGNYLYTWSDANAQRFNREVSLTATWDDHEVFNNWYEGVSLEWDTRYTEKSALLLAARAKRALLEHYPFRLDGPDPERLYRVCHWGPLLDVFVLDLRSYRGPNTANRQMAEGEATRVLGARQREWLKRALRHSTATWKVLMSSLPIGFVVGDSPDTSAFEGLANGDAGVPLGRELEIADLLRFVRDERVRNVVFVTSDMHYCTAQHYHPERARVAAFRPFWEFAAGPMHAGTFGPNRLDPTFGPEVRFVGIPQGMKPNRPPSDGLQFFGLLRIDGPGDVLHVSLHDVTGNSLWTIDLEPERD
jgi:alkaline phosphatase D